MSDPFGAGPAGVLATWVGAGVTLVVWSYLAGWRRPFLLAQHLLAGLATGYLLLLALREVLVPRLAQPLLSAPVGEPVLWIALVLVGVLAAGRWLPGWATAVPVSFLVAGTAAFALGGAVVGTLLPQLGAGLLLPDAGAPGLLNGAISLALSVLVLFAFLHGVRRGRAGAAAGTAGRWILLGGIGAWLGFLAVSRLSLLVDRLGFLLGDWLGVVR